MKKENNYLFITVYDNDFSTELHVLGKWLKEIILYYDVDLLDLANKHGEEYIKEYCKELLLKIYELFALSASRNEIEKTKKYLSDGFYIKILPQSEINPDGNSSYLYIQLDGNEKGYHFIV